MRQFYRGRLRCEAADCSHRLSTARSASARPGRPATAALGPLLRAPTPSMTLFTSGRLHAVPICVRAIKPPKLPRLSSHRGAAMVTLLAHSRGNLLFYRVYPEREE